MPARCWGLIGVTIAACSSSSTSDQSKPPPANVPPSTASDAKRDLGTTSFTVTDGKPEARAHFARGLAALHSFWYDEAISEFSAAIDADAAMNMAYWGAAMSRCKLLWGEDDVPAARALLDRIPAPDRLSPRERAWIEATRALLGDGTAQEGRKKFLAAMETLNTQYHDDESAVFLALALLSATTPDDPNNVKVRERAASLANAVYEHNPDHPGAAHYLIHAYDTTELASRALTFARAYAKIAPAAFHARHMPAHIFGRLGMWKEAVASCRSAWDASLVAAQRNHLGADHYDLHSLNWVVEMSFELGRRRDADAAMDLFAKAVRSGMSHQQRGQYAIQVASYMARTTDWSRVNELFAPLDTPATDAGAGEAPSPRGGSAGTHCAPAPASSPTALLEQLSVLDARARAASAQHDVPATKKLMTDLDGVVEKLRPFFAASQSKESLARIDGIDARRRRSLLARATADDKALLAVLRETAAMADKEPAGGENNPSGILAREEIADILLRMGQPKEAAAEYAAVLEKHPGRAHALLGAARAATKAGDATGARARYKELLAVWDTADDGTDGLDEAKAAVAKP